ncbi:uncharacterized protein ACJ7VT_012259 [Polymixia lowei]
MAGQPVSVTLGVAWKLQLDRSHFKPRRLDVPGTLMMAAIILTRTIFGVVYLNDCPQHPNIPNLLLGRALIHLIMTTWMTFPCDSQVQPRSQPSCLKASLKGIVGLSGVALCMAGDAWIFSVYQPNYDRTAADGLYCNKTLYTFAFWNAVLETFAIGTMLAKCCKGLLCQPVSVTLGVAWKLQLDHSHSEPQRLDGVVYLHDCPQHPNIPNLLLGMALIHLIMTTWITFPCESQVQPRSQPSCLKDSLKCIVGLSGFALFMAGDAWIFSVYQPNYDRTAADGLYCNKTLYTFAFWNAVLETFAMGTMLAKCCKGLLCCVVVDGPRPPNRNFHNNV